MDKIRENKRIILIISAVSIAIFLLLILAASILILSSKNVSQTNQNTNTQLPTNPSGYNQQNSLLVYGTWTKDSSIIKTINLTTKAEATLATLPLNIKRVNVLTSNSLIYINNVDNRDYGKEISTFSVSGKTTNTVARADEGFGIDEYVLSPNKRYLATFEVAFQPGSTIMLGGTTRIYSVDLLVPGVKNLIYEEVSSETNPIHYPRAITNSGNIYCDKFLPNSGAGWAHGMSISNFDGTQKQELSQMQDSTYGTQPILSPKGDQLIFAGYDGKYGPGTNMVTGFRQAILAPNTVEILDTRINIRQKLPNLPNTDTYNFAFWDPQSGNPIIGIISTKTPIGTYEYDLSTNTLRKINFINAQSNPSVVIGTFSDGKAIKGEYSPSTAIGNLGEYYARLFTNFYLVDQTNSSEESLSSSNDLMQFITIVPSYFLTGSKVLAAETKSDALQLETFLPFIKAKLETIRITQQSTPYIPRRQTTEQPVATVAPTPASCVKTLHGQCWNKAYNSLPNTDINDPTYNKFMNDCEKSGSIPDSGACDDTPLYLYGNLGKKVTVKIGRPIYNAIPEYKNGFDVTLLENGEMKINNKVYNSISYSFAFQTPFLPPATGIITSKEKMAETINFYAKNLGLNQKETADLMQSTENKIDSPFVFISFFDQQKSEQILPIDFNPKPNSYLNVVFYFKKLYQNPRYTPLLPTFPGALERNKNFTAVEISEIVD